MTGPSTLATAFTKCFEDCVARFHLSIDLEDVQMVRRAALLIRCAREKASHVYVLLTSHPIEATEAFPRDQSEDVRTAAFWTTVRKPRQDAGQAAGACLRDFGPSDLAVDVCSEPWRREEFFRARAAWAERDR